MIMVIVYAHNKFEQNALEKSLKSVVKAKGDPNPMPQRAEIKRVDWYDRTPIIWQSVLEKL